MRIALGLGISLALFLGGTMARAGGPPGADAHSASVTVTLLPNHSGEYPAVNPDDLRVCVNNQDRPVTSWIAADAEGPLDLVVMIDDSIKSNVALQYRDLADFFPTLPAGTRVRIAYAAYGSERVAQYFTTDYERAVKALRLPIGPSLAGGSIYQSVGELLKKWPKDGHRHAVLLISDGIDIYWDREYSDPLLNPDLQHDIDAAQSAGVTFYSIFVRGTQGLEGNFRLFDNGQSCLVRLTSETGGQAYFQETLSPLSFTPFLRHIGDALRHQYVLTYQPLAAQSSGYQKLRVTTANPGVHLVAPARVFIPKA